MVCLCFMVFNATFNNISVISWPSILLVEKIGVPGEIHWPAASHVKIPRLPELVVIVWQLDLQLTVQSVPITTKVVSSNPVHARCTWYTLCDKVCQWLAAGQWFSPGTPIFSTNKIDGHDITEILLNWLHS
jgi:hypothetical protein